MKQFDLSTIKSLCQEIANHPKANVNLKTYANAVCNGAMEEAAIRYNRPVQDVVEHQIMYVLANMAAIRDPRLKQIKILLKEYHG